MNRIAIIDWMSRTGVAALLAGGMIAGVATAASAAPVGGPAPVVVKVTAADLATPRGIERLALRINVAAERACGVDTLPIAIRFSDGFRACRDQAADRAVRELGYPQLAAALGRAPVQLATSAPH